MRLRDAALAVAIGEVVNGVREEGGENRGAKVREYLQNAGIGVPAPWCFTGEVEILTTHGFVRFDELSRSVRVAQVHPEDMTASFVHPTSRIEHRFDGPLITADSRTFGFTCDARHRFFGRWHGMRTMDMRPLSSLGSRLAIPRVQSGRAKSEEWSDYDLSLLAMFLADGSVHRGRVSLQVSRSHKLDMIRALGPDYEYTAPEAYGISTRPLTTFEFRPPEWLNKVFFDYKRPRYDVLLELDTSQLRHFVDAYAHFDGNAASAEGEARLIYTSDEHLRDWLQTAVTLAGWHSSFHTRENHGGLGDGDGYVIAYTPSKRSRTLRGDQLIRHEGERDLYCVQVPTGLIVCRDPKGTVFVTGNCAAAVQWITDGAARYLSLENPLDAVEREALVADYGALGEERGWVVPPHDARPGDLVLFRFGTQAARWNHIGFLEEKLDYIAEGDDQRIYEHFHTCEGNTSPGVGTNDAEREREGDGMYRKRRRYRPGRVLFLAWDEMRSG